MLSSRRLTEDGLEYAFALQRNDFSQCMH
jgi:hypothetical protein